MGLRSFPLYHRIFAHEATPGRSGGGIVPMGDLDAQTIAPQATLHSLDQLMESITPEGDATAYAVQRSLIPEAIGSFACLIVCHPSHRDGMARPASVTHARVVRVDSAEAWLDIDALIRLADGFPSEILRGSIDDLAAFLEGNEPSVDIAAWNAARFESVPRTFARQVVGACLSRWSRKEGVFRVDPTDSTELLADVVASWSILPLYAQLACPFSLHAQRGARVKALFTTLAAGSDAEIPDNLKRWSATYVDWVHDRPDDVRLLIEGREIRDLKALESQFEALTAEPRSVERVPRSAGKGAMSKQRPAAPERSIRRGGLDQETVAAINRQVGSAEESLRAYVDKRLGVAGARKRLPDSRGGGGDVSSPRWREHLRSWPAWVLPVAVSVLVLALIAALVYVDLQGRERDARLAALEDAFAALQNSRVSSAPHMQPPVPLSQHQVSSGTEQHAITPASELPGDGWALRFQGLSDHDPQRLGTVVKAIVRPDEQSAMPPATARPLGRIVDLLAAGSKLEKTDRALLRTLLLQCIADQAAQQDDPNVSFDGKFESIPKLLVKRVKDQLHVVSKPGSKEQTADFEAEAVLRWAQEHGL
jgi:hypothetical protein